MNFISSELKIFCSVKASVKGMKRQATDQEERFTKHMPDYRLLSRIYTELSNPAVKTESLLRIWAKDMKTYFTKEGSQMVNKHEKMFNITSCLGKCELNHNQMLLYSYQDAKIKNSDRLQILARMGKAESLSHGQ